MLQVTANALRQQVTNNEGLSLQLFFFFFLFMFNVFYLDVSHSLISLFSLVLVTMCTSELLKCGSGRLHFLD